MSKTTSLASQLRNLETPQTSVQVKSRASFLYDRKKAISIDRDTHFIFGWSGFINICKIDQSLTIFESLFNVTQKDLDRAMLSKEENENLNKMIKNFLYQVVSPYFLLKDTQYMLEWLIYRYSIHEFNLDDLIIAVLPYHETKLFPRVVQLNLKIRDSSHKWHWLHNVGKHGVPLPKDSLLNHLKSNSSTIKLLINHILETISNQNKIPVVLSFFTSTLVAILEDDHFILEDSFKFVFITMILDFISKSSKSQEASLVQSGYIVLSQLVTRTTIKASVLEKLLCKMAKYFASSNHANEENFLLTLLIVFEYQELEKIPERLAGVLNLDRFVEMTSQINSNYLLTSLLTFYISRCEDDGEYMNCIKLIDNLQLRTRTLSKVLEAIIEKKSDGSADNSKLCNVLQLLERRFPTEFDEATSTVDMQGLKDLIVSPFYTSLSDKNLNVFVGLTSANEGIRVISARHIATHQKEILKCTDESTKKCIADALTNTLHESNPQVLIELLSCKDLFTKMVPLNDLIEYGKKLLPRCIEMIGQKNNDDDEIQNNWITVRRNCFKLVSNLDHTDESQFWDLFVDYFLPLDATGLSLFSVIFETNIEKSNKKLFNWIKSIYTEELKAFIADEDYGSSIDMVTLHIAQYLNKQPNSPLLDVLNQPGKDNYRKHILGLCVLYHLLPLQANNFEVYNKLSLTCISILSKLVDSKHVKFRQKTFETESGSFENIKDFINYSKKWLVKSMVVTPEMIELFVFRIISTKQLPDTNTWFWHSQTIENNYIHGLFNFLCHHSHHGKVQSLNIFQRMLKHFVEEMITFCPKFLIGLWVKSNDPLLQARALQIASFALKKITFDEIDLLSLCIALQSPYAHVRSEAVKVLDLECKPRAFFNFFKSFKELIVGDNREMSIAMSKFLSENPFKGSSLTFKCLEKHLKNRSTPSSIRVEISSMLRDYQTNECVELFLELCNTSLCTSSPSLIEKQMCFFGGRKIIEKLPDLEEMAESTQRKMFDLFKKILTHDDYRLLLLELFDKTYVRELSEGAKIFVIKSLLNLIDFKNESATRRKLKKFLTDGELVAKIIEEILDSDKEDPDTSVQTKKRKVDKASAEQASKKDKKIVEPGTNEWKKIVILLEIFASKEKFDGADKLIEIVFKLLKDNLIPDEQSSQSEYFRSLLLVILSSCLDQNDIDMSSCNLSHIVESLRLARLRETRMQALSIINRISSQRKDGILEDIFGIFGFMGDDLIKYDDQYTLKILDDTMETLIPSLAHCNNESPKKIIETFIDAFDGIPVHRRLYLFQKLANLLGEENYLWIIVAKLVRRSQDIEDTKKEIQEFASALVCSFDASIQMNTIKQLMEISLKILTSKFIPALWENFRLNDISKSEFVREVIETIYLVVSSDNYVSAIAKSKWSDVVHLFNELFETNLLLIDQSNKTISKPGRYSNRLTKQLLRVLEKINSLLPGPEFISVMHRLLDSSTLTVRRKALSLLNARLMTNNLKKSEISMLRDFIQPIVNIIADIKENKTDYQIVTSQTGLESIILISKLLDGDQDSTQLLNAALKSILSVSEEISDIEKPNLLASIILCISQLVTCLQDNCLPLFPSVMSITLAALKEKSDDTQHTLLLSSLTGLNKIIKCFGKFLSSNLVELLLTICSLKSKHITGMAQKFDKVVTSLATLVPFRILMESLEQVYDQLEESEPLYVCLAILKGGLVNCDKTEVELNLPNIQKFALKLLDHRSIHDGKLEAEAIVKIEDTSIAAISTFVLKLSEASFRAFFYKVYDWLKVTREDFNRVITFYRLTNKLSDKLKELFSAFAAPYIVIDCVKQLKAFHIDSEDSVFKSKNSKNQKAFLEEIGHLIIINILTTLSKSFQHDNNSTFATTDRTKKLYPLILDQITNDFGPEDKFIERIDNGLIPCVQHLVRAVNDHNIVKDVNYQILLKTRENSVKVRYQSLHVLHQLILSMTEEYTPYIPEAIPFLAELHEDDSEIIQKLLLTVFSDIEKIFGEPISSYF
ncbi:HEAT repeat-containing protein 1 [Tetranychus urticae]|uniref:HEAT repeat-containing protein 1 n=1 Tax=Tetranychus urticae TaxID=32264 RepID=UPI00077B96F6|nr:HEAT repeat-containing protein 1 [Tetranychus urticae]